MSGPEEAFFGGLPFWTPPMKPNPNLNPYMNPPPPPAPLPRPSDRLVGSLDAEIAGLLIDSGRRLEALLTIGVDHLDPADYRLAEQRKAAAALVDVIRAGSNHLRAVFDIPKDGDAATKRETTRAPSDSLDGRRFRRLDLD